MWWNGFGILEIMSFMGPHRSSLRMLFLYSPFMLKGISCFFFFYLNGPIEVLSHSLTSPYDAQLSGRSPFPSQQVGWLPPPLRIIKLNVDVTIKRE